VVCGVCVGGGRQGCDTCISRGDREVSLEIDKTGVTLDPEESPPLKGRFQPLCGWKRVLKECS
jgi:hypothetical protein